MIRIEGAEPTDAGTVIDLVGRLLAELGGTNAGFESVDRERLTAEVVERWGELAAFLAWTDEGEPIGVVTVVETFAIYAYGRYGVIAEMYVSPELRGGGVGHALIEAVKGLGRARGWSRIDVTAPPEPRWAPALAFYEREGFVPTGPKLKFRLD